jgi:hypothetical protein
MGGAMRRRQKAAAASREAALCSREYPSTVVTYHDARAESTVSPGSRESPPKLSCIHLIRVCSDGGSARSREAGRGARSPDFVQQKKAASHGGGLSSFCVIKPVFLRPCGGGGSEGPRCQRREASCCSARGCRRRCGCCPRRQLGPRSGRHCCCGRSATHHRSG